MRSFSVGHLADHDLVRETRAIVERDRLNTADLLAHLGEIDSRRIYAQNYSSMFAWCVGELRLSEDSAGKRLTAARCARKFPTVLAAVADGRLHLSAVGLLATNLAPDNCDELVAMATHRTKSEIEHLLAARFPRPEVPTVLRPVVLLAAMSDRAAATERAPGGGHAHALALEQSVEHAPGRVEVRELSGDAPMSDVPTATEMAPALATLPAHTCLKLTPLSTTHYEFRGTLDRETRELLLEAQALLSHAIPSGDLSQVLKRALRELVTRLGRRKGAVARTPKPRNQGAKSARRLVANERHVPDRLKNQVWQRDGGRCTHASPG